MPKFDGSMSRLFNSLGADDTAFRKEAATAVRDAEQRWPLLKELNLKQPAQAPALTAQDRQNRVHTGRPATDTRKQSLSLPVAGRKLADGLRRMSPLVAERETLPARAERQQSPDADTRRSPFLQTRENSVQPAPPAFPGLPGSAPPRDRRPEAHAAVGSTRDHQEGTPRAQNERALSAVFARLDKQPEPEQSNAAARPSFLGRMGRR